MRIKYLLLFLFALFFLSSHVIFAADFKLSGQILDSKNNPIANGVITFTNNVGKTIAATEANLNGEYTVPLPQGTYTVSVSGPKGSDLPTVIFTKQEIKSTSTRNFTLALPTAVEKTSKPMSNRNTVLYIISGIIILIVIFVAIVLLKTRKKDSSLPEAGRSN